MGRWSEERLCVMCQVVLFARSGVASEMSGDVGCVFML